MNFKNVETDYYPSRGGCGEKAILLLGRCFKSIIVFQQFFFTTAVAKQIIICLYRGFLNHRFARISGFHRF